MGLGDLESSSSDLRLAVEGGRSSIERRGLFGTGGSLYPQTRGVEPSRGPGEGKGGGVAKAASSMAAASLAASGRM